MQQSEKLDLDVDFLSVDLGGGGAFAVARDLSWRNALVLKRKASSLAIITKKTKAHT